MYRFSQSFFQAMVVLFCWIAQPALPTFAQQFQPTVVDAYLDNLLQKEQLVGVSALVYQQGKVIYNRQAGYADRETQAPITEKTLFRIKSMSKPITSVATMILKQEGKLSLDDPVHQYIPAFGNSQIAISVFDSTSQKQVLRTVPVNRPMTIRDLLTHRSGLIYGWLYNTPLAELWRATDDQEFDNIAEMSIALGNLPLAAQPGSLWLYGRSTDVLGYVLEVAAGMPLDQLLKTKIFDPLQMTDTDFSVSDQDLDRLADVYFPDATGKLQKLVSHKQYAYPNHPSHSLYLGGKRTMLTGGEGLVSTIGDYLKFCQMLLQGGELNGIRLLTPASLSEMLTNETGELSHVANLRGYGFGLGFAIHLDPSLSQMNSSPGEYFWSGALNTTFWIDPSQQVIGIFMTQVDPFGYLGITRQVKQKVYEALGK